MSEPDPLTALRVLRNPDGYLVAETREGEGLYHLHGGLFTVEHLGGASVAVTMTVVLHEGQVPEDVTYYPEPT